MLATKLTDYEYRMVTGWLVEGILVYFDDRWDDRIVVLLDD